MSVNSASSSYAGSIASSIIQNQNSSPSTILQAMSQQLLSSMDTNGNGMKKNIMKDRQENSGDL